MISGWCFSIRVNVLYVMPSAYPLFFLEPLELGVLWDTEWFACLMLGVGQFLWRPSGAQGRLEAHRGLESSCAGRRYTAKWGFPKIVVPHIIQVMAYHYLVLKPMVAWGTTTLRNPQMLTYVNLMG